MPIGLMVARSLRGCAILALLPALLSAQVAFSRRVYKQSGRTYQQIWMWDPSDGGLKPLTDSERNHFQPACSKDGRYIYFLSGTDWYIYNGLWSFDRQTGQERKLSADPKVPVAGANQPPIADCNDAVWSQDNALFACSAGQDVLIHDAVTGGSRSATFW